MLSWQLNQVNQKVCFARVHTSVCHVCTKVVVWQVKGVSVPLHETCALNELFSGIGLVALN